MTKRMPRTSIPRAAMALLTALLLCGAPAREADAREPLAEGVVAEVAGRPLTFTAFCRVVIQHAARDLAESRGGPRAILDKMCEEKLVEKWCDQYQINVSNDELAEKWRGLSRQVQERTRGEKTLRDYVLEQGKSINQFRKELAHEMRKERVAYKRLDGQLPQDEAIRFRQVKLVIAKLMIEAKVEYAMPVVKSPQAEESGRETYDVKMPREHVCRIDGQPITRDDFGEQLVLRMPLEDVRGWLDKECKIGLMAVEGVALSSEALSQEIEHMRSLWPLERKVQREVIWTTIGFDDRFKAIWKIPTDSVDKSRFFRGLFGLVRRFRPKVTDEDIREEYEARRDELYGQHFIVTDIKAAFRQRTDPFGTGRKLPSREEAIRAVRKVIANHQSGVPFHQLVSDVQGKKDPSFTALKIRLYNRSEDKFKWERVKELKDGELSSLFETLGEVHAFRRESVQPASKFEDLRELLREFRARQKAREWLGKRLQDPEHVRIRWPLPQRGKIARKRK